MILRESAVEGALTAIDPEIFEPPSVASYSLGSHTEAHSGVLKTELLSKQLPHMDIRRVDGTAQDFINLVDSSSAPMPTTVFGAVDSVTARHEIAKLYADLTLDGSTGGATGTVVGLAEATPSGPCLRCYYPKLPNSTGPSPEEHLSAITGLDITKLADGDRNLSDEDLRGLPVTGRQLLQPHIGKPVCGLARSLGLFGVDDDYQPSAVFASQQAAALVIGALIYRRDAKTIRLRDVEYDTLFGPTSEIAVHRRPAEHCICQEDGSLIQRIRDSRRSCRAG